MLPAVLLQALLFAYGAAAWGGWASGAAAPRFAVVPAGQAREGRGHLDRLEQEASAEGFLDRVLGTNCFSQAVAQLNADCRRMEQEAKTRLALSLMNCQLQVQQGQTFPCHRRQSIKECTEVLSDRAHALFVEFLTHADTTCLYIQNQNFEKYTENMLDRLAEGAGFARQQLAVVAKTTGQLGKDTSALQAKAEAALRLLRQHSELEEEALKLQKEAREEAQSFFESLDAKQERNLELQDASLKKQQALEEGQATALRMLEEAEGHMGGLFELVEARAADLATAVALQAEAQSMLTGELGGLLDSSRGIRSAVNVVIGYQQRSDSVLMRLLGKSYTLEDAAFYATGVLAAMAAGASPATARAKLPVMALMGVSLLGERVLLDRLHMLMEIGDSGQIVMNLHLPFWLQLLSSMRAQPLQLNFKWTVRWVAVGLAAGILLFCMLSYRDYERDSYRLLRQLEQEQRLRHEEYVALINKHKVEMAALLGGVGAQADSADGGKPRAKPVGKGIPAAQLQGGSGVGSRQLVPSEARQAGRPAGHGWLTMVAEVSEDEGGDKSNDQRKKRPAASPSKQPHFPAAVPAPAAVTTPAAKAGRQAAAGAQNPRAASTRQEAALPTSRKRGTSDDSPPVAAVAAGPSKRRAASNRRGSVSDGVEAMAVDDHIKQEGFAVRGLDARAGTGKRTRRGSADVAAEGGAAPKRRARRS